MRTQHATLRAFVVLTTILAMVLGGVPAPALAEVAEAASSVVGAEQTARIIALPEAATGLVYDGAEQVGVPEGKDYELSGEAKATEAGDYVAMATLGDGCEWADGTVGPKEVAWSIARRSAIVCADDASKRTGETDPELTAAVEGLVGDDRLEYSLTRESGEAPGTYAITPAGEAVQGNYDVEFVAGMFTVEEAVPEAAPKEAPDGATPEAALDGAAQCH